MIETGFRFDGLHCFGDFGLLYIEQSSGRTISPSHVPNEYAIGGTSEMVRFDGQVYQPMARRGGLFPMESPTSEASAQAQMRRVAAWLKAGRRRLVFDYEPDKFLLAEMVAETNWSTQQWMDGGLDVEFHCQPFAYNLIEHKATATIAASGTLQLTVETGVPAPLAVEVVNTGSRTVTSVSVTVGARSARFAGLSLGPGQSLSLTNEPPVAALVGADNAFRYCQKFDHIEVSGSAAVAVQIGYSGGTGSCKVVARARGRFI